MVTKFSQVMSALRLATCVALAASLATTPLYAANAAIDLPQLGDPADNALSPAQEKSWREKVRPIAEQWAKSTPGGEKVLATFRELFAKAKMGS